MSITALCADVSLYSDSLPRTFHHFLSSAEFVSSVNVFLVLIPVFYLQTNRSLSLDIRAGVLSDSVTLAGFQVNASRYSSGTAAIVQGQLRGLLSPKVNTLPLVRTIGRTMTQGKTYGPQITVKRISTRCENEKSIPNWT